MNHHETREPGSGVETLWRENKNAPRDSLYLHYTKKTAVLLRFAGYFHAASRHDFAAAQQFLNVPEYPAI
jgi:hypothetical protein